ncbi:MAG TPA: hypothetical protein VGD65_06295 [Chryseosolibacter sp.]
MKKILFILIICGTNASAQQKITIQDSVLLSVLNNFIDELKLNDRQYKMVRVRLFSFDKELKVKSSSPANVGEISGRVVEQEYELTYSFSLEYLVNPGTLQSDPVTYYSIHRHIPILISTGVEHLGKTDSNNREFLRSIRKTTSETAVGPAIVWIVDVKNGRAAIKKPLN